MYLVQYTNEKSVGNASDLSGVIIDLIVSTEIDCFTVSACSLQFQKCLIKCIPSFEHQYCLSVLCFYKYVQSKCSTFKRHILISFVNIDYISSSHFINAKV